jgi:SAM-dependent methyltransferase
MTSTTAATGSAERWGPLWGARPHDWARNEEAQHPVYEAVINRIGVAAGQRVLEVGCGSGCFLRLAADRCATVVGLDASEALLELARARAPEAELRVGDMQFMPFADDSFDVVAGFNSFFFAADMVAALSEAGRVARPGKPVVIQVWGHPDRCDLTAMKLAAQPLLPPPDADAQPPALWEPGVLEGLAGAAGLVPGDAFDLSCPLVYTDQEQMLGGLLSPGVIVELVSHVGEEAVRTAFVDALSSFRAADGSYRFDNEWHTLIATA